MDLTTYILNAIVVYGVGGWRTSYYIFLLDECGVHTPCIHRAPTIYTQHDTSIHPRHQQEKDQDINFISKVGLYDRIFSRSCFLGCLLELYIILYTQYTVLTHLELQAPSPYQPRTIKYVSNGSKGINRRPSIPFSHLPNNQIKLKWL